MFEHGQHYNTKNGSEVVCHDGGSFVPFFTFKVLSGGHGVSGFPGKSAGQYYATYLSGRACFRSRANVTEEQIVALEGMSVLPGEVTAR